MGSLSVQDVQATAKAFGYEEVDFNEESRMLSFRGGPRKSTRINVYYTTGTVGSCLNHPKRGKTQLFRRNIDTLPKLDGIFQNPRSHTGHGYYTRHNIRQQWKHSTAAGDNSTDSDTTVLLVDSARRWLWVGECVGLVKNERERMVIIKICTKWDTITWDPGSLPSSNTIRHGCGTRAGLITQVLFYVVLETYGKYQLCDKVDVNKYWKGEADKPKARKKEDFYCGRDCPQSLAFVDAHFNGENSDVVVLQNLLLSLRKDIRIELVQWFLNRYDDDAVFTDPDIIPLRSKCHHNPLNYAHHEYGELYYPKKSGLCKCHGMSLYDHVRPVEKENIEVVGLEQLNIQS